jgi:arylsulfatase A-like enzyme
VYIPHPSGSVVIRDGWKLISYKNNARANGKHELYNLTKDPYETENVAQANASKLKELQSVLEDLRKDDITKLPEDLVGQKN